MSSLKAQCITMMCNLQFRGPNIAIFQLHTHSHQTSSRTRGGPRLDRRPNTAHVLKQRRDDDDR